MCLRSLFKNFLSPFQQASKDIDHAPLKFEITLLLSALGARSDRFNNWPGFKTQCRIDDGHRRKIWIHHIWSSTGDSRAKSTNDRIRRQQRHLNCKVSCTELQSMTDSVNLCFTIRTPIPTSFTRSLSHSPELLRDRVHLGPLECYCVGDLDRQSMTIPTPVTPSN